MARRIATFLLILAVGAAALSAAGGKDKGELVEIRGRVRLIGNEPFTELVISADGKQYHIEEADQSKLKEMQQKTVTIQGMVTEEELRFVNGRPAGVRRTLSKIKIISVE